MTYSLSGFLSVGAVMFALGVFTVLTRRNAIGVLMGIELVINAAGLNFVAFARFVPATGPAGPLAGQAFTLFIIAVSAAEVAVALAIVLALYSRLKSIDVEAFQNLGDRPTSTEV